MEIKRKKAVFNWSGGKDSALALLKVIRSDEYEIVSLLTTVNRDSKRSTMHAIPEKILQMQADSIGLPLHIVNLTPKGDISDYESEMQTAVELFRTQGVSYFIFGDIFLSDVRSYREKQLEPYNIKVVEPLWDKTSKEIMTEFLESGLKTVVVTTTADLLGKEYIGKTIDQHFIDSLPEEIDICGENGEYHTLCYDGPIFKNIIPIELGEPFLFSHEVGMEDGSRKTFSYWFANIQE
ncbi:MAG: diphthine--ammonia ligase [Bacteroidales bacterium]|nr:diphthine--ammonia ligase [Bacteroidales bacterium]